MIMGWRAVFAVAGCSALVLVAGCAAQQRSGTTTAGLAAPSPTASADAAPARAAQVYSGEPQLETYPTFAASGFISAADQPYSTFSADVDTAAYARIRRFLNGGSLPPADLVRIEEMVNYFAYDYPVPADRYQPFAVSTELAASPWNSGTSLLRVGIQGFHEATGLRPPLNLVFLVDVSGSMDGPDRLQLMQHGLSELVAELRPVDRVALVTYASGVETVLQPTSGDRQALITDALMRLSAGGSTNGAGGLEAAYDLAAENFDPKAVNRVILVTDGDFNVGASRPDEIGDFVAARRDQGIYMTVLGVGEGNLNDSIMQAIAQRGDGIAAYVDSKDEMRRALDASTAYSLFPIADDVKIQVTFNPALVAEYRLLGYETRAISREQFYDDAADGGDLSAGHSVTAIYEIVPGLAIVSAGASARPVAQTPSGSELALVEVRYQRPRSDTVEQVTARVASSDLRSGIDQADADTRFAAAVAGFGLLLRDDPSMLRGFDYQTVIDLAAGARGSDRLGMRGEFIDLVRRARQIAG